jgi:hypothetical protein
MARRPATAILRVAMLLAMVVLIECITRALYVWSITMYDQWLHEMNIG